MIRLGLAALLLVTAAPVWAQNDPLAPVPETEVDPADAVPAEPDATAPSSAPTTSVPVARPVVVPRDWRGVFAAIRSGDWASANAGIAALPNDLLTPVARSELYTARNSPRVELQPLLSLLAEAPDLPKANQLLRMAQARGATELPTIPYAARMVPLGSAPRRHRSSPVQGDPTADALRLALDPLVKSDSAVEAEALYVQAQPTLTPEGRAEAAQRVAWIYYILGRDADARRIAETASEGRGRAMGQPGQLDRRPRLVADERLQRRRAPFPRRRRLAARKPSLPRAAIIGRREPNRPAVGRKRSSRCCAPPRNPRKASTACSRARHWAWTSRCPARPLPNTSRIDNVPNVRRAMRLVEVGEYRAGGRNAPPPGGDRPASDHLALIALAKRIDFAGVQYFLAHNGRPACACRPPRASPCRAGSRPAAGASIRLWPTPMLARKAISAPPRSAPPARSA